jgi:hypothetical protein
VERAELPAGLPAARPAERPAVRPDTALWGAPPLLAARSVPEA